MPPESSTRAPRRAFRLLAAAAVVALVAGAIVTRASYDEPSTLDTTPAATTPASAPQPSGSTRLAKVSVSLYSGRVDPFWTPSASDQAEITTAIDRLPPASTSEFPPTGLGYIGFTAQGLSPFGRPALVYVLRYSVVLLRDGSKQTVLEDPQSTVFQLLEDRAPAHFDDPNARAVIDQSIRARSAGTTNPTTR